MATRFVIRSPDAVRKIRIYLPINSISIEENFGSKREFPIITTDDVGANRVDLRSMFAGIQQDSVNVCISAVMPNIDGYPYYKNEKLELAPNYVCKELPIKVRITDHANNIYVD